MSQREIQLPEGMSADEAAEVIQEYGAAEDPAVVSGEVVDGYELAKGVFASVLEESTPLSADALAENSMEALTEPFQNGAADDLDIETDTLRQQPETQSGGDPPGGSGGFDPDTLSLSEREELQRLNMKISAFRNRDMGKRADTLEAEMADLAGVDDVDDIDWEQL